MAEKLSDSIRRKVKGLQKALNPERKDAPAPKKKAGASATPATAAGPAGPEDAKTAPAAKPDKAKPQPWYRHRQRW